MKALEGSIWAKNTEGNMVLVTYNAARELSTIVQPLLRGTKWTPDMNLTQEFSGDSELQRFKQTYDLLVQKAAEFGTNQSWVDGALSIEQINQEKKRIAEIFEPGKFIAHAGYIKDLPSILKTGGLGSSWSAVNNGAITTEEIKRFPNGDDADSNALFLYPWERTGAGVYIESSAPTATGSKQSATYKETISDMAYIFPSEYITVEGWLCYCSRTAI